MGYGSEAGGWENGGREGGGDDLTFLSVMFCWRMGIAVSACASRFPQVDGKIVYI